MTTFKQKILAGEIKRADAMKVRFEDLHEEPGFNLRTEGEELQASIEALADHIVGGGQYPALEVRPRADGGVWIVDGHRRRRAIGLAIERGAPLQDKDGVVWVRVEAFTGNDADRTARIITSAEGRALAPLEVAQGYKRLAAFGWDNDRIAKTVGKTPQHVAQLLLLANANSDVQRMVADGTVAAATAVGVVREHGDNAGAVLAGELDKAKAQGKRKVTAGTMRPRALPRPVVEQMVDAVDFLVVASLPVETHRAMVAVHDGHGNREATVEVNAGALYELLQAYQGVLNERGKQIERDMARKANDNQATIEDAA